MNIRDEVWKDAFDQIAKREYEQRPIAEKEHKFSLKFRWRMRTLLKRAGKAEPVREKREVGGVPVTHVMSKRRVVCLVMLIALMAGGTVFAAEPLIRWLYNQYIEQFTDHVEIKNAKEAVSTDTGEFQKYELGYLPEGYELVSEEYDEMFQTYEQIYINQENKVLLLRQMYVDNYEPNLTSSSGEIQEVTSEELTGYYIPDQEMPSLVLSDGTYTITISSWESKEELLHMGKELILK